MWILRSCSSFLSVKYSTFRSYKSVRFYLANDSSLAYLSFKSSISLVNYVSNFVLTSSFADKTRSIYFSACFFASKSDISVLSSLSSNLFDFSSKFCASLVKNYLSWFKMSSSLLKDSLRLSTSDFDSRILVIYSSKSDF